MNRRTFFAGLVGALLPLPAMARAPLEEEVITGSGTGYFRAFIVEGDCNFPGDIPIAEGEGGFSIEFSPPSLKDLLPRFRPSRTA